MRTLHRLFLVAITPTLGCCGLHHLGGGCMDGHEHGAQAQSASQQPGADTESSAPAATYSCPMHPEVQATFPGACPVCGMTLEKK